ncbi:MAG: OmpA family protein [Candidatus Bathyarchaeia archaeon]
MFKGWSIFSIGASFALFLTGCLVTEEAYRKKEMEVAFLNSQLLSMKNEISIMKETEGELKKRLARVEVEGEFMKMDREDLEKERILVLKRSSEMERDLTMLRETLMLESEKAKYRISQLEEKNKALETKIEGLLKEKEDLNKKLISLKEENAYLQSAMEHERLLKEERFKEFSSTYESLIKDMKNEIERGEIMISELKGRLKVEMLSEILFDPGSTRIKKEGIEVLNKVGKVLKEVKDKEIRIEGHTDSTPISGALKARFSSNWELSVARATEVVRYLQDRVNIDPSMLCAAGYAHYRPSVPNDTPEGKAKNRRIEIVLVPKEIPESKH